MHKRLILTTLVLALLATSSIPAYGLDLGFNLDDDLFDCLRNSEDPRSCRDRLSPSIATAPSDDDTNPDPPDDEHDSGSEGSSSTSSDATDPDPMVSEGAQDASAIVEGWVYELSDFDREAGPVSPTGDVYFNDNCWDLVAVARTGALSWSEDELSCQVTVDKLGNSYYTRGEQIVSRDPHGELRWTADVGAEGPAWPAGVDQGPAIGPDGRVYVLRQTHPTNPFTDMAIFTGEGHPQGSFHVGYKPSFVGGYEGGIVTAGAGHAGVHYYNFEGEKQANYPLPEPWSNVGFDYQLLSDGSFFAASAEFDTAPNRSPCSTSSQSVVGKYAPAEGLLWTWKAPQAAECNAGGLNIAPTPDGGVVVNIGKDGEPDSVVTKLDDKGHWLWSTPRDEREGAAVLAVDKGGQIVGTTRVHEPCIGLGEAECRGFKVKVWSSDGELVDQFVRGGEESKTFAAGGPTIGKDSIYVGTAVTCTPISACRQAYGEEFKFRGLVGEYGEYLADLGEHPDPPEPEPHPNVCGDATLIGVRGSGEKENDAEVLDYAGEHADAIGAILTNTYGIDLVDPLDADGESDGVRGLAYPAVSPFVGLTGNYYSSRDSGVESLEALLGQIRTMCGVGQPIVLAGYSQGADVIHTTLERNVSSEISSSIKGVVLIASPRFAPEDPTARGTFLRDYPNAGLLASDVVPETFWGITRSYCVENDAVCTATVPKAIASIPGIGPNKAHTDAYDPSLDGNPILADAAALLARQVLIGKGSELPPNPVGQLNAYAPGRPKSVLNPTRPGNSRAETFITASEIYARGAPSVAFQWDFTSDGVVDVESTAIPWVAHELDWSDWGARQATTSVLVSFADGSEETYKICIRRFGGGSCGAEGPFPDAPSSGRPSILNTDFTENLLSGVQRVVPRSRIRIEESNLLPNATYRFTMFSEPTDLGTYISDEFGNLEVDLTLPADAPTGVHTLELRGPAQRPGENLVREAQFNIAAKPATTESDGRGGTGEVLGLSVHAPEVISLATVAVPGNTSRGEVEGAGLLLLIVVMLAISAVMRRPIRRVRVTGLQGMGVEAYVPRHSFGQTKRWRP